MGELIAINQKRFFTIDEARDMLPVVKKITKDAFVEVKKLSTQLGFTTDKQKREVLEKEIQQRFKRWQLKVGKLGCEAKGMWLVDFDSGEGYYCWHYPEPSIQFFHGYFDGYRGRVKVH